MTFYSKSLPVGWGREARGSRGGERVLLGKKVPLSGRALLDRKVAF